MWRWCDSFGWSTHWDGGGGGWVMSLIGLAVLAAILWAVFHGGDRFRDTGHRQGARADRDDALRILKRRLAEGDISLEEYERLRQAVES
jgi:putative membrane protein